MGPYKIAALPKMEMYRHVRFSAVPSVRSKPSSDGRTSGEERYHKLSQMSIKGSECGI